MMVKDEQISVYKYLIINAQEMTETKILGPKMSNNEDKMGL
jgi:hypothetical protein